MRPIFITFEAGLTILWFWFAANTFDLFIQYQHNPYMETPDYGTAIGGALFLALGLLTLGMLVNEFFDFMRRRFNIELNPLRRLALAAAAADAAEDNNDDTAGDPSQE